jgi:hypothetical protein
MLQEFNGAILFDTGAGGELVSLFGITEDPPLSALEWGEEWYIDKFTPRWRAAGTNRQNDWAIAMMNYGGLVVLNEDGSVKEWDTSRHMWNPGQFSLDEWVELIFREGETYVNEH